MPATVTLNETGIVNLDASGNGTAQIGPLSAREVWNPASAHVQVASNINEAQCTIYAGPDTSQQYFRDNTLSGSTGDSTDRISADVIKVGNFIWAVWAGGDPGSQAILAVTGTKTV